MTSEPREDALPLRRVVLCADDFAQTEETIEGILALVDAERLSAISCLVESPLWADAAVRLRSRPQTFDIGLHFNLTHEFAGDGHRSTALPLTALAACFRMMDRDSIAHRLHRQLDLFEEVIGRPPDFIDGHQYVHQLPVIRDALVSVLRSRDRLSSTAIRITVPSRFRGLKGWLIARLGGRELLETVCRESIPHNTDFAGIYNFSFSPNFAEHLSHWLADLHDGGLIVCHPARAVAADGDPIARARARELAHLESPAFPAALHRWRVQLARFRDLPVPRESACAMPAGILSYGAAGLAGTLAHYAALVVLVQAYHTEPVAGSTAGAIIGAAINYWLNHRFTFRSTAPHRRAFARFLLVAMAGMVINAVAMFIAVHMLGVHYIPGQVAATGLAFLVTYELNRRWTF